MTTRATRISRRTLLRGCGAALALPLLESMQEPLRAGETPPAPPRRAAFFYIPNGVVVSDFYPDTSGAGPSDSKLVLTPTLKPLQAVRSQVTLFTGLDRIKVAGTDGHAQAGACWLSTAAPDELSPAGYPLKRTLDQVMADATGRFTPFRSLQLSCNPYEDNKESVYFDNISWYGHGHVATSIRDPREVFDRLFKVDQRKAQASILDLVLDDARALQTQLGRLDRRKLDEYMDSVRAVERQIARMEGRQETIAGLELTEPGKPWQKMERGEFIQIMGDLMILALQTDLTRVASMMVSPERWGTPQQIHGVFDKPIVHHSMSHGQGDDRVRRDLARLDRFHVEQFARLVEKMARTAEGSGSLLDNMLFTLGSGISNGRTHVYTNLPTVVAGKGGGALEPERHVASPAGTPVANLWLALARALGSPVKRLADSTGSIRLT